MYINSKDLINNLSGDNKSFIKRVSKQQEENYGNIDVFEAKIGKTDITMYFGDYYITFFFRNGVVYDTIGTGQGHKYHKNLQSCAEELYNKATEGTLII